MPIYEHLCPEDGPFDIFVRKIRKRATKAPCPDCGTKCASSIGASSSVIKRDWNEQANEQQRNPYEQSKAQAWNTYNEQREQGVDVPKPTEAGIQVGAKAIAKSKR